MVEKRFWSLGGKLALLATPFVLAALVTVALTLWMSWQLDGGAAAVNEAGRMRMQVYRLALTRTVDAPTLPAQLAEFDRSIELLRHGDAERPLFVPWDDEVAQRFSDVESAWRAFRGRIASATQTPEQAAAFVVHIDALVAAIERHLSRWTAMLYLLQFCMMVLAVLGTTVLLYTGYSFVLEPVANLKRATEQIQRGELGARVAVRGHDEFATLAGGFNAMAAHLQSMYGDLEAKVVAKTAELGEQRDRLQALYGVTALLGTATSLDALARDFTERIRTVARADGAALRWSDEGNARYVMLAAVGLPPTMTEREHCLLAGECGCGAPDALPGARVIPIRAEQPPPLSHCANAGFATVVCVPVRHHERLHGEIDLFYHARHEVTAPERSLLDALASHLAAAMENLRLGAREREAAVAQERTFLARELHDSIAQSLAFLKLQVQLLRDARERGDEAGMAQAIADIDEGVRESYGDVRELLVHFRTRTSDEDIEAALLTTLRKFELQSGIRAALSMQGHGVALAPDTQLQVLHVVQEALSNARKHAHAARVWLDVQQQPQWRFEVRDDGRGFEVAGDARDETHVGLRIMAERAERIGATLDVFSTPGRGSSIVLTLPTEARASEPASEAPVIHAAGAATA
ncbi:MAG: type IV pili methyl-accepting chemotaxis transducer N-terminal domain-containing protein [Burkholderiales bacterium]|nr:type IV pili methyl-accepting chemotaxis transducer N-terminal domain-containing protein [Burkholderiales bacterium]